MLLFQNGDLMKEAVRTVRFAAIAWIYAIERDGPVEDEPVVWTNLPECVVHMCELVRRNVSERIPFCRPVGVIANDFERLVRRRCDALRTPTGTVPNEFQYWAGPGSIARARCMTRVASSNCPRSR